MKATARWVLGALCALLTLRAADVRAQDLVVVLSSAQDAASADKLAELIPEPFERVAAASLQALPPAAAGGCRTSARIELHLDSVGRSVRLIRCRDATVLTRGLDPTSRGHSPYLGAFVAAELIAIDRELAAAEARTAHSAPPQPSPPAAESGSPRPSVRSALELQLRGGAELAVWGAPFAHSIRPSLGLGVVLAPQAAALAFLAELSLAVFALAEQQRAAEALALRRHDGTLHAGVRVPAGALHVTGFVLLRASLTSAEYRADLTTSETYLRLGVGAGAQADLALSRAFCVYLRATLDLATSRSQYRVAGQTWLTDPASLLWVGFGLLLRLHP